MANTPNYDWPKPTVGADENAWGGILNDDLDSIDSTLKAVSDVADAALPAAGGTIAGSLTVTGNLAGGVLFASAGDAPTTGKVFFGNTVDNYIRFDGTNFTVGGAGTFSAPTGGFVGKLTGNVTGNVSGSSGSCTGNAATATTAASCSGNAATSSACTGNAATATSAASLSMTAAGHNAQVDFDGTNIRFIIDGVAAVVMTKASGVINEV